MENDVLKNKIVPWQEKGRWYHLYVESDGSNWSVNSEKTDELLKNNTIISGPNIRFNDPRILSYELYIIDIKIKMNKQAISGNLNPYSSTFRINLYNKYQAVQVPAATNFTGSLDIWLFIA